MGLSPLQGTFQLQQENGQLITYYLPVLLKIEQTGTFWYSES